MTAHEHYMKNAVAKALSTLREDLDASIAGRGDVLGPATLDIREMRVEFQGFNRTEALVRRVYIETTDSSSLAGVGWVTNECLPHCMECQKYFSLFTRRHHCRACGRLLCNDCCKSSVTLKDFSELGVQRVCMNCNINNKLEISIKSNITWGTSVLTLPGEVGGGPTESACAAADAAAARAAIEALRVEAEHAARLAALRREEDAAAIAEAANALSAVAPTIKVIPFPGFVIKTRRTNGDDNKIFINVFHHTTVKDSHLMLTYVPFTSPPVSPVAVDAASPAQPAAGTSTATSTLTPPPVTPLVYVAVQRSSTEDRDGYVSLLYNVLVSSAYFERGTVADQDITITHPTSINKIIQVINKHYKESLCEDNFVVPRIKVRYHGPAITKGIDFVRADIAVTYVDASLLTSRGGMGDDGSVSSRGVSPQLLAAAAIRANSEKKMNRLSMGRTSPNSLVPGATDDDSRSEVSDLTVASNLSKSEKGFVRAHRSFALTKSRSLKGHRVLSDEMLRLNARQTMSAEFSESLKEQSIVDPTVLVGYQIVLPYTPELDAEFIKNGRTLPVIDPSYIYVIIDTAKNNLRKTEYNISNNLTADSWVKLKRGKNKQGVEFRVLRKVNLDLDAKDGNGAD